MRVILLALILLISACAQNTNTMPPATMQLQKLEKTTLQASLPEKPIPKSVTVDGVPLAAFSLSEMNQLTDYAKQAKANTEGLNLLVTAHNQTIDQHNLMVDIAKQQEARANQNYALYVKEFNAHESDKQWWTLEKIVWQAIAIIGLAL